MTTCTHLHPAATPNAASFTLSLSPLSNAIAAMIAKIACIVKWLFDSVQKFLGLGASRISLQDAQIEQISKTRDARMHQPVELDDATATTDANAWMHETVALDDHTATTDANAWMHETVALDDHTATTNAHAQNDLTITLDDSKKATQIVPPAPSADTLKLTRSDQLQAASNLVQWSLMGAALMGAPTSLVFPVSVIAGLGSEIATFCALPKDASWLRKALSMPVLAKCLIHYNPWIAKGFQITSLYNTILYSSAKIKEAWQQRTLQAAKAGAVHLFNLASHVAFTAQGLLSSPEEPTTPAAPDRTAQLEPQQSCPKRMIMLTDEGNEPARQACIAYRRLYHMTQAHRDCWNHVQHLMIPANQTAQACLTRKTIQTVPTPINSQNGMEFIFEHKDCAPAWNVIGYLNDGCDKLQPTTLPPPAIIHINSANHTLFKDSPSALIDSLPTASHGARFFYDGDMLAMAEDPKTCRFIKNVWHQRDIQIYQDSPDRLDTWGTTGNIQSAIDEAQTYTN